MLLKPTVARDGKTITYCMRLPETDFPSIFARSYYKPQLFIDIAVDTVTLSVRFGRPDEKTAPHSSFPFLLSRPPHLPGDAGAFFPTERLILQADEEAAVNPD